MAKIGRKGIPIKESDLKKAIVKRNNSLKSQNDILSKSIKDREKEQADKMEEAKDRVAFAHHQPVGGYRGRLY